MNVPGPVTSEESRSSRSVFVSYATADRKEALSVTKAIERRGPKCWISTRDVAPGENYQEEIVRAIRTASAMVLVFSQAANNSDEIKKELSLASRYHVPVMALRIEDVEPSDAFAYELSTRQWIDAFDGWDQSIDALTQKLAQISGGATAPAEHFFQAPKRRLSQRWLPISAALALLLVAAGLFFWNPFATAEPLTVQISDFKALGGAPADAPAAFQDALRASFGDDNAVQVKGKNARYSLGGSIRSLGDRIQYSVNLTDNRTGEMVWSAAHDPLPDSRALAPQQIAERVTWIVRCGLADAMEYQGPLPTRALALYMQHCQFDRWFEGSPDRRMDVIKKVTALVPGFSKAWARLASDAAIASWSASQDNKAALIATSRNAANRAIEIDPKNGYAYLAMAQLQPRQAWAVREKLHEQSVEGRESDCGCTQEEYAQFLRNVDRPTDAEPQWLRGLDKLPHAPSGNQGLILTEFQKSDMLSADRAIAHYKEFWNGAPGVKVILLIQAIEKRRWAEAATLTKPVIKATDEERPISEGFAALASGNAARISRARDTLIKLSPTGNAFAIILLAQLGAPEQALESLRANYAAGDPDTSLMFDPALAPLRNQPRWTAILSQLGLIDYWRSSHKPPEFCKAANAPALCKTL